MLLNAGDIREPMDVFSLDGQTLGQVGAVWPNFYVIDDEPGVGDAIAARLEARTDSTLTVERRQITVPDHRDGYFHVSGEGSDTCLYVPFSAIQVLFPGESVTISDTSDEAMERYTTPPPFLANEERSGSSRSNVLGVS